jgi:hypothetical protein
MSKQVFISRAFKATAFCSLLFAIAVFASCSKNNSTPPPPVDKSALKDSITTAQALHDGTAEGTKPGEYEVGSQSNLQTAIDAAKAVDADASSTQQEVTSATANLHAAMETYKSKLISEISPANLIGYWKMNGNAADSSGNGHDGTVTQGHAYYGAGTPTLATDRFSRANMCYHFDGGGNIEVPYAAALNPPEMSISIWFKKSTAGRTINTDTYTMTSLNRWNGYKLQLQSANKVFFTAHATDGTDTTYYDRDDESFVADNDTWYHTIVTFKAGEMDFYINGDLVKSWTDVPFSPLTLANPINFVIGQDLPTDKYLTVDGDFQVAWGGFWTGDLDDVMFYNVALSATQVKSIYENQKTL